MSDTITCEYCSTVLKNKYNLKAHLSNNKNCLKMRSIPLDNKFVCTGCDSIFTLKANLSKHIDTCKSYNKVIREEKKEKESTENLTKFYETKMVELKEQYERINETKMVELKERYERTINEIKKINERTIDELRVQNRNLLASFEKVATHAVDRPTTTTTTINNIKNQFSDKYFMDNITQEEVKRKCQNYLTEEVFLEGQRGIAKLCTEHIIKTNDHKALMLCTDTSRKKFKYIDDIGNLKEDFEARVFTEKVSKPIKDVSKIIYETILSDVKIEKDNLECDNYSRKAYLNDKELKTIDCFVKISYFDHPEHNMEFKNELAILNK